MKQRFRKISSGIVSAFFVIGLLGQGIVASTAVFYNTPLPDAGDSFIVFSPEPDRPITGTTNISFQISDDNAGISGYTVGLYDSASCTSLVGNIFSGTGQGTISQAWNSRTTQSTSNLADGEYCLRVCTEFINDANENYTACNGRRIRTLNNNTLPVITSSPNKSLYLQGETYSYQVSATDAEGDALSYRLIAAPDFLVINNSTGLVTSSSPLTTNGEYGLRYSFTVGVSDNKSGEVSQQVVFEVYREDPNAVQQDTNSQDNTENQDQQNETPQDDSNQNTSDDNQQQDQIQDAADFSDFEFTGLESGQIFRDDVISLSWDWGENTSQIKEGELAYSEDGEVWKVVANNIQPNTTTFDWSTFDIEDGSYVLRMRIFGNDQTTFTKESPSFEIDKSGDSDQPSSTPIVIDISPEIDQELEESPTEITAELVPSLDQQVQEGSVQVLLDGVDISSDCSLDGNALRCDVNQELEPGRHNVSITFSDTAGQEGQVEWTFEIAGGEDSATNNSEESSSGLSESAIIFIGILIALGIILIVIPWILYTIWRGGNNDSTTNTYSSTATYSANNDGLDEYTYPDININTNLTPPEDDYLKQYDIDVNTTVTPSDDFIEPKQTS